MPKCLPKTPAGDFGVCAGYAPDRFLTWLTTAALDDIRLEILRVCVARYALNLSAQVIQKTPAGDFGVCAGYAPGRFLAWLTTAALNDIGLEILGVCVGGYALSLSAQVISRNTCLRLRGMRQVCAGRHVRWSLGMRFVE